MESREPRPGGCGLFRAATISPVPSIGAKNSVGYGGSPLDQLFGWLERMRLLRGSFKGKGAGGGMSPFPVTDSPETTPPVLGSNSLWLRPKACIRFPAFMCRLFCLLRRFLSLQET